MSTLEKPGIAWADQQSVRQPVRRCGFRELRPPRGGLRSRRRSPTWRARSRAVPSRSRSRRVAFRHPSAPGERAGVPPPRRSRSTPTTSGSPGQARRHRLGRLARRRAATRGLGLRGLAARVFGPPGEPPSKRLSECGHFVGSRLELHDGDEPNCPLRVEDRVDAFNHLEDL